jgi:transcriptional regulator with XRE-family HTH domain
MTQHELAAASGLHQSVVSRIEQGVANPTVRTLGALARALDARLTLSERRG